MAALDPCNSREALMIVDNHVMANCRLQEQLFREELYHHVGTELLSYSH